MHLKTRLPRRGVSQTRDHADPVRSNSVDDAAIDQTAAPASEGATLGPQARTHLEHSFGHSLDRIRIHADPAADALARLHHARALASGTDIFFREGAYAPDTPGGLHLLSHEAAHVLQQDAAGRSAGGASVALEAGRRDDPFEHAADRAADAVMSGRSAPVSAPAAGIGVQCEDEDKKSIWDMGVDAIPGVAIAREAMNADSVGGFFKAEEQREAGHAGEVRKAEGWLDGQVDRGEALSKAGNAQMAAQFKDVPVLGTAARGLAAVNDFSTDVTGGFVKGIGGLLGGAVQMAENPIGTVEGIAKMTADSTSGQTIGAGVSGLINMAQGKESLSDVGSDMWGGMQRGFKHDVGMVDALLGASKSIKAGKPGEIVGRVGANLVPFLFGGGAVEGAEVAAEAAEVADVAEVADAASAAEAADAAGAAEAATDAAEATQAPAITEVDPLAPTQAPAGPTELPPPEPGAPYLPDPLNPAIPSNPVPVIEPPPPGGFPELPPSPATGSQGLRTTSIGTPTGDIAGLTEAEIDALTEGIEGNAQSSSYFEMPGQNPSTGGGLQDIITPEPNPNPNQISYNVNHYLSDVGEVKIADAADVPVGGAAPGESVIPEGVGTPAEAVPETRIVDPAETPAIGADGEPIGTSNIEVRSHSTNPRYPDQGHTTQVNTPQDRFGFEGDRSLGVEGAPGRYLLPDGTWKTIAEMTNEERAAAHWASGN